MNSPQRKSGHPLLSVLGGGCGAQRTSEREHTDSPFSGGSLWRWETSVQRIRDQGSSLSLAATLSEEGKSLSFSMMPSQSLNLSKGAHKLPMEKL